MSLKWTATRITADAADKIQANAGLIVNRFDVAHPVKPAEADIVCDTTGDITITCKPDVEDFFEDVNNAPNNTKEGKRITGWTCSLGFTCLSQTVDTLKLMLGAAETLSDGGIAPRRQYQSADFKDFWWLGDMIDEDKVLAVKIINGVSTEGLTLTTSKNGKGTSQVTITGHISTADLDTMPMAFYILTKAEPAYYDATKTYAINDQVTYDGKVYKCSTAISTPEAWTESHWTEVTGNA